MKIKVMIRISLDSFDTLSNTNSYYCYTKWWKDRQIRFSAWLESNAFVSLNWPCSVSRSKRSIAAIRTRHGQLIGQSVCRTEQAPKASTQCVTQIFRLFYVNHTDKHGAGHEFRRNKDNELQMFEQFQRATVEFCGQCDTYFSLWEHSLNIHRLLCEFSMA